MRFFRGAFVALIAALTFGDCSGGHLALQEGARIVFFGDSITQLGVKPNGYVTLIRDSIAARHPGMGIEVIGAGISGNKVADLRARLVRDVMDRKPTVVVIYIGINDVWHWQLKNLQGTTKEDFEAGLREIIVRIQYSGARVILCTPSVIGEKHDGSNPQDQMLDEYAAISRSIAKSLGTPLCDLRKAFGDYLRVHNKENAKQGILTTDGVHLSDAGNRFVAGALMQFFE